MKLTLALLYSCTLLLLASSTEAATRYASPTGTGTACTVIKTPCDFHTMIAQLVAGDTGILLDGNYTTTAVLVTNNAGTSSNRITLQAQNPHKAIIFVTGIAARRLRIAHSYWTMRDLIIDGNKTAEKEGTALIHFYPNSGTLQGTIVEGNILRNGGNAGFAMRSVDGCAIHWNQILSTGWQEVGEGFYLGSSFTAGQSVTNCIVKNNRVSDTTDNFIDFKGSPSPATNFNFHHNIFENHALAGTRRGDPRSNRLVAMNNPASTTGNQFDNNIVRNSLTEGTSSFINSSGRFSAVDNVFYGNNADVAIDGNWQGGSLTSNVFCGLSTVTATNIVNSGNSFSQAQPVCDADVARIQAEMALDSDNPRNRWTGPMLVAGSCQAPSATKIRCTWTNNNFPPLSGVDNTKVTATRNGGGALTESSTVLVPGTTNITETTVAETLSSSDTLVITFASAAVHDSANILAQSGSGFDVPNAATGTVNVTNNISGAAPSYTLTQSKFRVYRVPMIAGALDPLLPVGVRGAVIQTGFVILTAQINCTGGPCPSTGVRAQGSWDGTNWFDFTDGSTTFVLNEAGGFLAAQNGTLVTAEGSFSADDAAFAGLVELSGAQYPEQGQMIPGCLDATGLIATDKGALQRTALAQPTFQLNANECLTMGALIKLDRTIVPGVEASVLRARWVDQTGVPFASYVPAEVTVVDNQLGVGF